LNALIVNNHFNLRISLGDRRGNVQQSELNNQIALSEQINLSANSSSTLAFAGRWRQLSFATFGASAQLAEHLLYYLLFL
jgi:hypothetical protein